MKLKVYVSCDRRMLIFKCIFRIWYLIPICHFFAVAADPMDEDLHSIVKIENEKLEVLRRIAEAMEQRNMIEKDKKRNKETETWIRFSFKYCPCN